MTYRYAARAVIVDENNLTAVLEVNNGQYYKIPGGGVENGETSEDAAKREAREEAGCEIKILNKIGEFEFFDEEDGGFVNHSVCFLAKKTTDLGKTAFEDTEEERGFKLIWVTFKQAKELFSKCNPKIKILKTINSRDFNFLAEGEKIMKLNS